MVWLLVLHVASAMVYVGGHLIENLLLYRPEDVGGRAQSLMVIRAGEPAINVAAPIMILTGVGMVILDDAWSFTSPFVIIGIGAIVASTVVGIPILREMKTLQRMLAEIGETDEVRQRYRRLSSSWSVLAVVYLVAVWAMVFKP